MFERIINSTRFTSYRKRILTKIYSDISSDKQRFCCHVKFIGGLFICWKDLKEVQETLQPTQTIRKDIGTYLKINPNCTRVWFENKEDRLKFLTECLEKFDENN